MLHLKHVAVGNDDIRPMRDALTCGDVLKSASDLRVGALPVPVPFCERFPPFVGRAGAVGVAGDVCEVVVVDLAAFGDDELTAVGAEERGAASTFHAVTVSLCESRAKIIVHPPW